MSGSVITLQHSQKYFTGTAASPLQGKALLRAVTNELLGVLSGASSCSAFQVAPNGANPRPAAAVFDVGTAGTQTLTIGGVDFAVSFTTLVPTAAAIVTAVNASSNALINKVVQASQLGATITLTTAVGGEVVTVLGVPLTAVTSNPTGAVNQFVVDGGGDDIDAAALGECINAHPVLSRYVKANAVASSNVLHLFCLTAAFPTGPLAPPNVLFSSAGTIVASTATLAAVGFVQISSFRRDVTPNHITIAATGTNAAILNSETRLVGGAGGQVTSLLAYP